mmetsp:Transcript_144901/g.263462  ORF Transcript_144901/g.263462 Transcript_144901/m.263462 type:complete len:245 (+) Transcript_144901:296-1030(+)
MVNGVELTVLSEGVAKIHSDRLVELPHVRLLRRIGHGLLDQLQALCVIFMLHSAHVRVRVGVVFRQLDSRLRCQSGSTTLAQVHVGETCVFALRPWIVNCLWVQIKPHIAELIDPTHEVTISVGIAAALTAAHGDAHDVAYTDLLHCGEGCDLTIVDDFQWHIATKVLGHAAKNVDHLLLIDIRWHAREDVAPCCLIVCTNGTCGTATHAINLRKRILCNPEGICDHLVMVVRVRVCHIPLCLF